MTMIKKLLTLTLAVVTIYLVCQRSTPAQTDKQAAQFSHVKHEVEKLGFDAKVEVRLQDGSTLKGRISGIAEDQFVITDKHGTATKIPYSNARRVMKDFGSTRSQAGFLALSVGALAGAIALIVVFGRRDSVTR